MDGSKFITKAKLAVVGLGITSGLTMTQDESSHDNQQTIGDNANTLSQFFNVSDENTLNSRFVDNTNPYPKNTRPLTQNEIDLLKPIFKESIDYDKLRISKTPLPKEILGDEKNIVAGAYFYPKEKTIYPSKERYSNDYAKHLDPYYQKILIHETAHMWQHENFTPMAQMWQRFKDNVKYGTDNLLGRYSYTLDKDKDLLDYGQEQQAEIITDYFLLKNEKRTLDDFQYGEEVNLEEIINGHYEFYPDDQDTCKEILSQYGLDKSPEEKFDAYQKDRATKMEQYEAVLANFIKDPTFSNKDTPQTPGANPRVKTFSPSSPKI